MAWWAWAVGLAAAASLTTNPWLMALLVSAVLVVVSLRRGDQPWARAFRLYLVLAVVIVLLRVLFRVLLGGGVGDHVLLDLPEVPLPEWVAGVTLLGPVTRESVLAGLYEGLRLGTVVLCVGAANALANPKRFLATLPPAMYEIGTVLVVAVTAVPHLVQSTRRVRSAQLLRGGSTGRVRGLRRVLVPVLEDALERSLALAAGMDTRGYGRAGRLGRRERRRTGALVLLGLCGVCVGVYGALDPTAALSGWWGVPLVAAGALVAVVGLAAAGGRVERTRYRPLPWHWPETVVLTSGVLAAAMVWHVSRTDALVAHPGVTEAPQLSALALAGVLVGAVPAVAAPPPGGSRGATP